MTDNIRRKTKRQKRGVKSKEPSAHQLALLQNAMQLHMKGDLQGAENGYRTLTSQNAPLPAAYVNLAVIVKNKGALEEAVSLYEQAIQIKPDFAEAYSNMGNAQRELGQIDEAVHSCQRAIQINSNYAEAYNNLSNAQRDLGQFEEAAESCRRALEINPDYAEALNNLAVTLKNLDRFEEAIDKFELALKIKPDYALAYSNLGNAQRAIGLLGKALKNCERAVKINPNCAEFYINLGIVLGDLNQPGIAAQVYRRALDINPDHAEAHNNLGIVLKDLGRLDEAIDSYKRALKIRPNYAGAYNHMGIAQKSLGDIPLAISCFEKALELDPSYAEAYRQISEVKTYQSGDLHLSQMQELLSKPYINRSDRKHVYFALSKAHDDLGEFDESFNFLKKGNQIRKQELSYTIDTDVRLFSKIKELFTSFGTSPSSFFPESGASAFSPIFIVGMPRSGTTLVEQILASHSRVYGAGELDALSSAILPTMSRVLQLPSEQIFAKDITDQLANKVRVDYHNMVSGLQVREPTITDKMPLNFRWVGFILSAFPGAKIINLNRNPMATCWSIFKHHFTGNGNGYAYDLADTADYYKLYLDLMAFWRGIYKDKIYDLNYETLTEYQEKETRKLLEFCELGWEDQCLDFYKTKRVVKTASATQVRKKMYQGSSEAWRKYEDHLRPLFKALENPQAPYASQG